MTLYTVRTWKYRTDQPKVKWCNSYEVSSGESSYEYADFSTTSSVLMNFEKTFHTSFTHFDRVVWSTYQADSKPYNPDNLHTSLFNFDGNVSGLSEKEALDTALWIRRQVDMGRAGKAFYRNVLLQTDVDSDLGRPSLSSAGKTRINALWLTATSILSPILNTIVMAGQSQVELIYHETPRGEKQKVERKYSNDIHVRPVREFVVAGCRRIQMDNAYFDKGE